MADHKHVYHNGGSYVNDKGKRVIIWICTCGDSYETS